jgi:hypothetical protein
MKIISLLAAVAMAMFLGCASIQQNPTVAKGVIQIAAYELFDRSSEGADVAENAYYLASQISGAAQGEVTAVSFLRPLLNDEIQKLEISPQRQVLANLFITIIEDRISEQINAGYLNGEELVIVKEVCDWIMEAAEIYIATNAATGEALSVPNGYRGELGERVDLGAAEAAFLTRFLAVLTFEWMKGLDKDDVLGSQVEYEDKDFDLSLWGYITSERTRGFCKDYYALKK